MHTSSACFPIHISIPHLPKGSPQTDIAMPPPWTGRADRHSQVLPHQPSWPPLPIFGQAGDGLGLLATPPFILKLFSRVVAGNRARHIGSEKKKKKHALETVCGMAAAVLLLHYFS